MADAITDPGVTSGWHDASGNENGDACTYIYGTLSGAADARFNQTINVHHYRTQEEFSNQDFVPASVAVSRNLRGDSHGDPPVVVRRPSRGGGHLIFTGTGFPGARPRCTSGRPQRPAQSSTGTRRIKTGVGIPR